MSLSVSSEGLVSHVKTYVNTMIAIWDYAEAFSALYTSGLLGPLDSKKHKIVLCGHSAGSVAVYVVDTTLQAPVFVENLSS